MTYQIYYRYKEQDGICSINEEEDINKVVTKAKEILKQNGKEDAYIIKIKSLDDDFIEELVYINPKPYKEKGYENREEYIQYLANEYNLEYIFVLTMALTLGENEDFDGLVMACEDAQKVFEEGE
jgi:hypothetical protein